MNFEFLYCQKKTVLHGMLYSWYVSVIRFIEDAENAECLKAGPANAGPDVQL